VSVTEQFGEYTTDHVIGPVDGIPRGEREIAWKPQVSDTVIRRDLNSCVDEASDFNTHEFLDDADQAWSITRGKMRWEFVWTFSHSGRALRGYEAACPTSLYPPKQLVGSDSLCLGWNDVLSKVPDAQTAFASPDQSLILVFTKTQVLALRREVNGLATPFARVFLPVSKGPFGTMGNWKICRPVGPTAFPARIQDRQDSSIRKTLDSAIQPSRLELALIPGTTDHDIPENVCHTEPRSVCDPLALLTLSSIAFPVPAVFSMLLKLRF